MSRYRMYPVVIGNGRNLQSDAIINGYHVPKGVSISLHLMGHYHCSTRSFHFHSQTHVIFPHLVVSNLAEYFPEPERFLPERWIKRGELSKSANVDIISITLLIRSIILQVIHRVVRMLDKRFIRLSHYHLATAEECALAVDLLRMNYTSL